MALTKITPQMFDTSAAGHDFNIDNGTFVVDASANRVGIGTASPATPLHITGITTFDGDGASRAEITSSTANSVVSLDVGGFNGTPSVARDIRFLTNAAANAKTERMRISSAGHFIPAADSTYNIGANATRFANAYFDTVYGTLATAAQTNITSVGTLTGLTTSGNISVTGQGDFSTQILVGNNNSHFSENNLRFQSAGHAYIDHNTTGQHIIFRTSNSSSLDQTVLTLSRTGNTTVHGLLYLIDGSNSSPALTFSNDNDTGIVRVTTNALGIVAAGSRKFYVNATNAYFQNLTQVQIDGGNFYVDGRTGFRTQPDSNYAIKLLQSSSLTHGGYFQINGGTATGLEINATSGSYSGTALFVQQSSVATGGFLARFANSSGNKVTIETDGTTNFAGNVKASDIIAAGSGGLSLQTDEGTKRLLIKDNGDVKVGQLSVTSATSAPLHVAKASTDVQAVFGDNNSTIDDPQIRVIGRNTANSAARYTFAGLDADNNYGKIGYNAGAGVFKDAIRMTTEGYVQRPEQPFIRCSGNSASRVTNQGTTVDPYSNWSTQVSRGITRSGGIFTVPVAGEYLITYSFYLWMNNVGHSVNHSAKIYKGTTMIQESIHEMVGISGTQLWDNTLSNSIILEMSGGDTFKLVVHADIYGGTVHTNMSAYLL